MKDLFTLGTFSVKEETETTTLKEDKDGGQVEEVSYIYKLEKEGVKVVIKSKDRLALEQGQKNLDLKIGTLQATLDDVKVSVNGKELPTPEEVGANIKKELDKQSKEADEKLKAEKAKGKK